MIRLGKEFTAQGAVDFATGGQVANWPTLCGIPNDRGLFGKGNIQWKLDGLSELGQQMWSIGGSGSNPGSTDRRHMKGTTYAFRLYNRALTNDELVQNRKVDEVRFHGVLTETNVLVAVEGEFAPTEAPGAYDVAGTWTFTAGNAVDGNGRHWTPRGTVENLSDGSVLTRAVKGTEGYTWTDGNDAVKLTWHWIRPAFAIYIR